MLPHTNKTLLYYIMKTPKICYLLGVTVFIALSFNNCDSPEYTEQDPFITGDITEINSDKVHGQKKILVEEDTSAHEPTAPNGKKVWFRVASNTAFFIREEDGSLRESAFEDMVVGQTVKGWVGEVITDSYPQQGKAKRIVVVKQ